MIGIPGWRGKAAAVLPESPPYPYVLDYLYVLFGEYLLAIENNGMAPAMATWTGLQSWNEIMRHDLEPWELRAIAQLSQVRAVVHAEQIKQKSDNAQADVR
jgi:hypothetical protein